MKNFAIRTIFLQANIGSREVFEVTLMREDERYWYVSNHFVTECQVPKWMFTIVAGN